MKKIGLLLLLFTLSSAHAARIRKELSIDHTKDNLVASVIAGSWVRDHAVQKQLGFSNGKWDRLEFDRNDRVVILLPDQYVRPLRRFRLFMAGWMRIGKLSAPFVLIMYKGNPTIMYFLPGADNSYREARSISVFAVPGKTKKQDLLFLAGSGKSRILHPFRRR